MLQTPNRRRLLPMKHVPGATMPRQQSSSRALNLPRVPLALSQSCALANTAQLTPLGHHSQQPRLVSPARFSSSFARPPVPRSQSPLRRLAERSIERTGSQSLAGLPATQDEYQELPIFLSQPVCGQYVPARPRNSLSQHPAAMYVSSPPSVLPPCESQQALSAQDPGVSCSQRLTATPPQRPGPANGGAWGMQGLAGGASATAAKLLNQIARMSSCEEAMERMTKRLASLEEVCGRMEAAVTGLHAGVLAQADRRPPSVVKLCDGGTQTDACALARRVCLSSIGTQTSLRHAPEVHVQPGSRSAAMQGAAGPTVGTQTSSRLSTEVHAQPGSRHAAARVVLDQPGPTAKAAIPAWKRRNRALADGGRERAELMELPRPAKRPRPESPALTLSAGRGSPAGLAEVPLASVPPNAGRDKASAPVGNLKNPDPRPQPGPWRTKASADPFVKVSAKPGTSTAGPTPASDLHGTAAASTPQQGRRAAVPAAEHRRPRLPPANMAYARPSLIQEEHKVLRQKTAAGRVQPHTAAQQSDSKSSGAGVCRAYAGQAAGEHAFRSVRSSEDPFMLLSARSLHNSSGSKGGGGLSAGERESSAKEVPEKEEEEDIARLVRERMLHHRLKCARRRQRRG